MGELEKAKLLNSESKTVHTETMLDAINEWDINRKPSEEVKEFYSAAPGMIPTTQPFSQNKRYPELDLVAKTDALEVLTMRIAKTVD